MNARILFVWALGLLLPAVAAAQGYGGLGTQAQGYRTVQPGRTFAFPADHAPHPGFRIEWWYVTANLKDEAGNAYGVQWTLFRQGLTPEADGEGWDAGVVWMGHAAVTSATAHESAERFARGGIGQAGVELDPFSAYIDDWSMAATGNAGSTMADMVLTADGDGFAYELRLTTRARPVLHGKRGYSLKSPSGQASYYYSQPFYEAAGTVTIGGDTIEVAGRAWLDREWSSQPLDEDQEGWDWFALHLPEGDKLMLYRLRDEDGSAYVPGTWIEADGTVAPLASDAARLEPLAWSEVAGRSVPTRWRIRLPERDLDIEVEALNPQSWMDTTFAYWEGPVRFAGTHSGVGYLEMTGYGGDSRKAAIGDRGR